MQAMLNIQEMNTELPDNSVYELPASMLFDEKVTEQDVDIDKRYVVLDNNGWNIAAYITADYFVFIRHFAAYHVELKLLVNGNVAESIFGNSQAALDKFLQDFPLYVFDKDSI